MPVKRRLIFLFLKYALGLGLLAYVVWANWNIEQDGIQVGLSSIGQREFYWPAFLSAAGIGAAAVLLTFLRWYYLVRAQGLPFTRSSALRLGLVGFFFSTFLPGSVGGDIIKAAFIAKEQSRRTVAVATVLIDRAVGLCGLIWLVAILGGYFWSTGLLSDSATSAAAKLILETIIVGAAALMGASIVFWIVLGTLSRERSESWANALRRIPKIGGSVAELWRALWMFRYQARTVYWTLAMALVGHLGFVMVYYFSSRTLNEPDRMPSLETHFLIVPVGMSIQAGFPAPGGVGGGEYGYGKLYEVMGFLFAAGVLGSLVQRCINWGLALVGYVLYLNMKKLDAAFRESLENEDKATESR
ncbi:MAG: flippase-like domain-containing protein [Gemmataceae bacterium]|nr:flippase-like domain-containing protein [Gemmataceae bacterium]MCI0741040.1 flippase-like domain-containing protein [Gemmataceae bacterium]